MIPNQVVSVDNNTDSFIYIALYGKCFVLTLINNTVITVLLKLIIKLK